MMSGMTPRRHVLVALGLAALASCSGDERDDREVAATANRDGLVLRAQIRGGGDALHVRTTVRNERATAVHLVPDQCGRVTEVLLPRTRFQPEGRSWSGSVQAAKAFVLRDQRSRQGPDRFHPRRPGDTSSTPPPCTRPARPVRLPPGGEIAERWELPLAAAYGFQEVGSAGSVVRAEVVEAEAPDELEFLDVLPAGEADDRRAGRNLRIERATSSVIDVAPSRAPSGASLGQVFDRLLADPALRRWIDAQPSTSWRLAQLTPSSPFVRTPQRQQVRLRLVTTRYERAALAFAREDGSDVSVDLPGDADRTRVFPRRAGSRPPGIALIDEPHGYVLHEDVLPGSVTLPSGRLVVGEYLLDEKPLDVRVRPGSYPVHVTLARYRGRGSPDVALATMVLSNEPTIRWKAAGSFAVDGGSATFTSPEGVAYLRQTFERDEAEWTAVHERVFDSRVAHDYLVTQYSLDNGRNLVEASSGVGDGAYPVFVGYDGRGRPTRVVADFLLLHLDWPA
jgi:hypothetical protein